jgi:hypothetical protein
MEVMSKNREMENEWEDGLSAEMESETESEMV